MIRLALFCGILFSCAHTPSLEKRCTPLLSQILSIQETRRVLSDGMGEYTRIYKEGIISREAHRDLYENWLKREIELRGKVTLLYNRAYGTGCL